MLIENIGPQMKNNIYSLIILDIKPFAYTPNDFRARNHKSRFLCKQIYYNQNKQM